LRSEAAALPIARYQQFPEQAWLLSRIQEASAAWENLADTALILIAREVFSGSTLDREVLDALPHVPEWISDEFDRTIPSEIDSRCAPVNHARASQLALTPPSRPTPDRGTALAAKTSTPNRLRPRRLRRPLSSLSLRFGKMANSDIIASMLRVLADYEVGRVSPDEVESSLESRMQALERVDLPSIHKVRTFTHRLVSAHRSDGEMEFEDDERVETVLSELRDFLRSLPS
jgi:hypothetical protein